MLETRSVKSLSSQINSQIWGKQELILQRDQEPNKPQNKMLETQSGKSLSSQKNSQIWDKQELILQREQEPYKTQNHLNLNRPKSLKIRINKPLAPSK